MAYLSHDYINTKPFGTSVCTKVVCILLASSMFTAATANARELSSARTPGLIESGPAPKLEVSLMLHSLINSLKNVLDDIENTQIRGANGGSLDAEANSLNEKYKTNGVCESLSPSQILSGLDDCDQINMILNDPDSEYELSPESELVLKAVVNDISWELANGQ